MDNEFKFGFWNYLPLGIIDKDIVYKWKDMNCNLFMSFRFMEGQSKKEDMIALLDEAQKVGAKVIINDERTEYLRLKKMPKEEFVKGVKQAVKDFGNHPAVFGFYGGDEPDSTQEDNFIFTMKLLKELMPNHYHYGNLNPYWSSFLSEPQENHREDSYYYQKMNRMIEEGHMDILAFDQYTQCFDEDENQKEGVKNFIVSANHYYQIARNHNIPLYISVLSIDHFNYREPSEADIRWQINVCAAIGAKAVIWFYFHQNAQDVFFGVPPFLGEKAYITPMYGRIQRQQYLFNERFKKVFDQIDIDDFFVQGEDYGKLNYHYGIHEDIVKRFDIHHKDRLAFISFGHYRDDPEHKVVFVINGDQFKVNAFSVYFADGEEKHFRLLPGEMIMFDRK